MNRPVDATLYRFILDLRDAGLHDFADALDCAETDRSRAQTLTTHCDSIQIVGRYAFLRRASASLWATYEALHRATIEADRAAAALDAYRTPRGDDH